jgi:sugar-specific transcriptional regulator TrmB
MADLDHLASLTDRRARMAEDLAWADREWRALIVAALEEHRATDVAKAAGVSRPRVYQIRDGK